VTDDPEEQEPLENVSHIRWLLIGQRYRAQDWCESVRGEDP